MDPYQLRVRVCLDADATQAAKDAEILTARFRLPAEDLSLEPYAKFAGWHQLGFTLAMTEQDPNQALAEACQALGSGWDYSFSKSQDELDGFAIWNPGPDHRFAVASARFAELGLFRPDDSEQVYFSDLSAEDEALADAVVSIDDEDF